MAAHIAAGLLSAPVQRRQHGQERAPDTVERGPHAVASGVQALFDVHAIGDDARTAATRFHDDYMLGVLGVRDREWLGGCSGGAADPHIVQLARVRAVGAPNGTRGTRPGTA